MALRRLAALLAGCLMLFAQARAEVSELQVAQQFGLAFLPLMIMQMSQPDSLAALVSGAGEIDNHFAAPPFQQYEIKYPGIRTILRAYDVLGGPATFNVVWTSGRFRDSNPETYAAFYAAFEEATAIINRDKRMAAETYLRLSRDKASVDDIYRIIANPDYQFTLTPQNIIKYAEFMHRIGSLKSKPSSWKDVFFPNAHHLPGS